MDRERPVVLILDDKDRLEEAKGFMERAGVSFRIEGEKTLVLDGASDAESRFIVRILLRNNVGFTIE